MSSLVNSINQAHDHDIQLAVLDDHSSPEAVADIQAILTKCKFPTEFIPVEDGTGNAHTMKRVYDLVETYAVDLWYHVEDDYLHRPEAIQDMIDSVIQLEQQTRKMVAINPHDDVWRYIQEVYASYILFGPSRHYRTVKHTTFTCFASRAIYDTYREHFQDVVILTEQKADWIENKSINLVWKKPDVELFSPIPGLAFHIMDLSGKDPYVDIEALWDSVPKLWTPAEKPKFAIVSMYNEAHEELAKYTWPNKERYANLHGYTSFVKTDEWTLTPIHFEKLKLMLDMMTENPDIDWVWWLDNDAIITNPNIELETIADPDYHVIITSDIASINAGSFMVRNSQIMWPNGEKLRISNKAEGKGGAASTVSILEILKRYPERFSRADKAMLKEGGKFYPFINAINIIAKNQSSDGAIALALEFGFIDERDAQVAKAMLDAKSTNPKDLTARLRKIVTNPAIMNAKTDLPDYKVCYHLIAALARLVVGHLNSDKALTTEFFKFMLSRANLIQVNQFTQRQNDGVAYNRFDVVWPPVFTGKILFSASDFQSNKKCGQRIAFKT